jgi:type I restriction enzyme, S subunit
MTTPRKGYKSIKWYFGKDIEIPLEWKVVKFRTKIKMEYGSSLTEDLRDNLKNPVYGSGGLIGFHSKPKVKGPGIIVARKGSLGNVFFEKDDFFPIDTVYYITEKETELNLKFLFYYLLHMKLENLRIVTSKPGISRDDVYSYRILDIPPLEQDKIASILSNVDSLIESTEQVIENSKKVKVGLIQKLMKRGIGHTKFKKVPWLFDKKIEIPEEWELKQIKDIAEVSVGLVINPSTYFDKNGTIPMITGKNIIEKGIVLDEVDLITEKSNELLETTRIWKNDLVTMRVGEPGRTGLVKNEHDGINCASVIITRKNKKYNSQFLLYLTKSELIKQQIIKYTAGGVQPVLNIGAWEKFLIIYPSLPEQQKIVSILSNIDSKITSQEQYKEKLLLLKKSLMQKLLTGEVRVKV